MWWISGWGTEVEVEVEVKAEVEVEAEVKAEPQFRSIGRRLSSVVCRPSSPAF
jgi:hypothetical protein